MMSCWPGDKTASVMTSWTTKVLNSRRRRRRFLEFRSFASAATAVVADDRPRSLRRPTPAAPRKAKAARKRSTGRATACIRFASGSRAAAPEFGSFGGSTPPTRMFQKMKKERSFADTR